jgi:hypothetical protein
MGSLREVSILLISSRCGRACILTPCCEGYSGIMDLVLAILPWNIIMSLQMKTKEKLGVALAMSMGVL